MSGVVGTVDLSLRKLLLCANSGRQSDVLRSIMADPQVQRLNQIRPGDRVTATYYQALVAQMVSVFSTTSQPLFEGVTVDRRETAEPWQAGDANSS
jgi:hypothetical protein